MSAPECSNPVGSLNQRCQLLGASASYDLVRVTGPPHSQVFTIEAALVLGNRRLSSKGQGGSKKSAKDEAARNMLREIDGSSSFFAHVHQKARQISESNVQKPSAQCDFIEEKIKQLEKLKEEIEKEQRRYSEQRFGYNDIESGTSFRVEDRIANNNSISHNSVGQLQELCQARGLGLPRYNELGDISGGQFSIQCVLGSEATAGEGPNKKEAKRLAAAQMIQKVSRVNQSSGSLTQSVEKGREINQDSSNKICPSEQRRSFDSMNNEEQKRSYSQETKNVFNHAAPHKKHEKVSNSMMMDSKNPSGVKNAKSFSDWSSFRDERPRDWWSLLERVTSRAGVTLTRVEERCERSECACARDKVQTLLQCGTFPVIVTSVDTLERGGLGDSYNADNMLAQSVLHYINQF